MESYEELFSRKGIAWAEAKAGAERFIPAILEADPRYMEEMKGIAQGAAVELLDVLAINCRSELLYAPAPTTCELPPGVNKFQSCAIRVTPCCLFILYVCILRLAVTF